MFIRDVLVNSDKQIVHSLQSLGNKGKFLTFEQYFTQKRNKAHGGSFDQFNLTSTYSKKSQPFKYSTWNKVFHLVDQTFRFAIKQILVHIYLSIVCNMITFLKCQRTLKWNILKWTSLAMPLFFFFCFFLWIKARPPVDTTSLDLSELMDRVHCICTMLPIANPCKCKALLW